MNTTTIPFNVPFITGKEQQFINDVFASKRFSGDGQFTKKAEQRLKEITGAQRVILTPSCTAAMELAALVIGIKPGDEVVIPSYTFVSTANPFVLRGAKIVFADVDPVTMNMDTSQLPSLISSKTKAIVPVHYAGVACNMNEIMAVAEANNIVVIEDAAQCIGATYNGKALGSIGHFGCLSFHDTKNIQCGEGGALLINDEEYTERAETIRDKGTNRPAFLRGDVSKYSWIDIGSSFLTNELTAAFLLPQLEVISAVTERRKTLCKLYEQNLAQLKANEIISFPETQNESNAHLFFIKINEMQRSDVIAQLQVKNVDARFHYVPLHSSPAGQKFGMMSSDQFTTSESEKILRLPLYYNLSREDVAATCEALSSIF